MTAQPKEIVMNTTLSTKLAALALTLMINSVIMGSVALLFNARLHDTPMQTVASTDTPISVAHRSVGLTGAAA